MKTPYDYLIVGAGLFGATFAHLMRQRGKRCLVIDKRQHTGGNVHCERIHNINVHQYGAHIFHTSDEEVWRFVTGLTPFNRYTNSPVANYKGRLFNLPFNMNTFHQMWGIVTPEEARQRIESQRQEAVERMKAQGVDEPRNLEEQALLLIGRDLYEHLVKEYTEKQWGRPCTQLPAFIIKRLPVRFVYDNNYFNALYQGIPIGGYTKMIANLLDGIEVRLNTDYLENKAALDALAEKVVYTGPIDAYFDYKLGTLEYRSVRFENELLDKPSFQGNAAVNYTDRETPWTRIIEHKWFEFGKDENGNIRPYHLGHFFIAIDTDHFLGQELTRKKAGEILRSVRASQKAPGAERIFTAGEKEWEIWQQRKDSGVPINDSVQKEILEVRDELGLTQYKFPWE